MIVVPLPVMSIISPSYRLTAIDEWLRAHGGEYDRDEIYGMLFREYVGQTVDFLFDDLRTAVEFKLRFG